MKSFMLLFAGMLCNYAGFAQQTLNKTITHDGLTREYRLYIPAAYNGNEAVPLLFNLHGYGSNNAQQDFYGDFKPIADTANFIICLPNGTFDGNNTQFWNVGFAPSNVDDVGFISSLIDIIDNDYNIDLSRVYSTGMSNGGFMSYSLACQLSNRIAAIASVTGSMTISQQANCSPNRPVPVMQIHGTADATVPYGGTSLFLHIDTLIEKWRIRNGCTLQNILAYVPNTNVLDGATATRLEYNACDANADVVWYVVQNGTHTWPGAPLNLGVTCMDFSASLEIWKFFLQYQHPNPIVTSLGQNNERFFTIHPNPVSDLLVVSFSEDKINNIAVYDISGRKMLDTHEELVNVQSFPKGIYFCKVTSINGNVMMKKFLKE